MRRMRTTSPLRAGAALAAVAGLAALAAAAGAQARTAPAQVRPLPPHAFTCARNDLTAYTGVVIQYRRVSGRTTLRIRTDWDTTESVTLRHPGTDDPSGLFRLAGQPFTTPDWAKIERTKGALRAGTRATAWVCADGAVLVDWSGAAEGAAEAGTGPAGHAPDAAGRPGVRPTYRYAAHWAFMRLFWSDVNVNMHESSV